MLKVGTSLCQILGRRGPSLVQKLESQIQVRENFVLEDACQVSGYVTHKVAFSDKETQLTSNRRAPGPGRSWAGSYHHVSTGPFLGIRMPPPNRLPLEGSEN